MMAPSRRLPFLQSAAVLVYSTRGPRRALRSVHLVESSWGTADRPQSWCSALVRCERLQKLRSACQTACIFWRVKFNAWRPVGVLVPPLDASVWNLRRSLQIDCLLVCYRPLARLVFNNALDHAVSNVIVLD